MRAQGHPLSWLFSLYEMIYLFLVKEIIYFFTKNINLYLIYQRIEFEILYIDHISKDCVVSAKGPKKEKLLEQK